MNWRKYTTGQVREAQIRANEAIVTKLEERKGVDYLYAEADGIFVREIEKKKSPGVHHAILYEGWDKNGKRVSLQENNEK